MCARAPIKCRSRALGREEPRTRSTPRALAVAARRAAARLGAVVDLHDENFEHETQCTGARDDGRTALLPRRPVRARAWVGKLKTLDRNLTAHDSNWINVAMVECEKRARTQKAVRRRRARETSPSSGRIVDFTSNETNTTSDFRETSRRAPRVETLGENGGRDVGLYIPRGPNAAWYSPLTDALDG